MKDRRISRILKNYFRHLFRAFGPQHWWPGTTRFEVIAGAILTQNTSWKNVERAIGNLRKKKALNPGALHKMSTEELAALIRPAGYFNIKARRLKNFVDYLFSAHGGSLKKFLSLDTENLRRELLHIHGIGPETADSILLYAAGRPVFVVDAYTKRVLERHGLTDRKTGYDDVQKLFMDNLPADAELFNEYHALFVRVARDFCRTKKPLCRGCPLGRFLPRRALEKGIH